MAINGPSCVFAPPDIEIITAAFDHALRDLELDRSEPLAETVAKKMMEIALRGEGDRGRLCEQTMQALRQ